MIKNIDARLLDSETMSDKEIIDMVSNENVDKDREAKECEINECDNEVHIINHAEALLCINQLKDYFMSQSIDTNDCSALLKKLEEKIVSTNKTKQTELTVFFKNTN